MATVRIASGTATVRVAISAATVRVAGTMDTVRIASGLATVRVASGTAIVRVAGGTATVRDKNRGRAGDAITVREIMDRARAAGKHAGAPAYKKIRIFFVQIFLKYEICTLS